jgi:hypothetical protein
VTDRRRSGAMLWFVGIVSLLALVYLVVAMVRPEWFSN